MYCRREGLRDWPWGQFARTRVRSKAGWHGLKLKFWPQVIKILQQPKNLELFNARLCVLFGASNMQALLGNINGIVGKILTDLSVPKSLSWNIVNLFESLQCHLYLCLPFSWLFSFHFLSLSCFHPFFSPLLYLSLLFPFLLSTLYFSLPNHFSFVRKWEHLSDGSENRKNKMKEREGFGSTMNMSFCSLL